MTSGKGLREDAHDVMIAGELRDRVAADNPGYVSGWQVGSDRHLVISLDTFGIISCQPAEILKILISLPVAARAVLSSALLVFLSCRALG